MNGRLYGKRRTAMCFCHQGLPDLIFRRESGAHHHHSAQQQSDRSISAGNIFHFGGRDAALFLSMAEEHN